MLDRLALGLSLTFQHYKSSINIPALTQNIVFGCHSEVPKHRRVVFSVLSETYDRLCREVKDMQKYHNCLPEQRSDTYQSSLIPA